MAQVIYKYQLKLTYSQQVPLQHGAKILCVQTQDGVPVIWALGDPDKPVASRWISIIGTGVQVEAVRAELYIGTVQIGLYVWHVFEFGSMTTHKLENCWYDEQYSWPNDLKGAWRGKCLCGVTFLGSFEKSIKVLFDSHKEEVW